MLFNSLKFFIFFPLVTALYFLLPHKYRWVLLLAASAVFYMAFVPAYILILVFLVIVDYFLGIWLEKIRPERKKVLLVVGIILNLGALAVFKYFDFFSANISALASFLDWNYSFKSLSLILPIGLSFFTLQSLGYIIEVYRGRQKAERHPGMLALFIMFYPQLLAGPIGRPQNLLHQFREKHYFEYQRVVGGLRLMLWGLFLKMVIADRLAIVVDRVYDNPIGQPGISLLVASIFFTFQIFCDFAGYSDIAIGAARVMGFDLMKNFNNPYSSQSISEFWKRWHISLSSWLRDYIYIPLGGSRVLKWRYYYNLIIVFLISGLWHGAGWTFIIWGALHGFYLIFSDWSKEWREKFARLIRLGKFPGLYRQWKVAATFCLVAFAWIFFRANSLDDAFYIITHLFSGLDKIIDVNFLRYNLFVEGVIGLAKIEIVLVVFLILAMQAVYFIGGRENGLSKQFDKKPLWLRWSVYYVLILLIMFFGIFGERDFIYFQF